MLGIPYLPAFADPTTVGTRVLNGVNYASAAAGILDETGQHFVLQLMHLNLLLIRNFLFNFKNKK